MKKKGLSSADNKRKRNMRDETPPTSRFSTCLSKPPFALSTRPLLSRSTLETLAHHTICASAYVRTYISARRKRLLLLLNFRDSLLERLAKKRARSRKLHAGTKLYPSPLLVYSLAHLFSASTAQTYYVYHGHRALACVRAHFWKVNDAETSTRRLRYSCGERKNRRNRSRSSERSV